MYIRRRNVPSMSRLRERCHNQVTRSRFGSCRGKQGRDFRDAEAEKVEGELSDNSEKYEASKEKKNENYFNWRLGIDFKDLQMRKGSEHH